jgi:ferredoxin-NADP reductase/Na+-translocating ferredoxin:NAD+ oxidoreductase RnfD subunit
MVQIKQNYRMKKIIKTLNSKLDATGMYRVVSVGLLALAAVAILFGFAGLIPYAGSELILSALVTVGAALSTNVLFAKLFSVHANHESALITGLILFFLILPAELSQLQFSAIIAAVTFFAIASKYVLVWRKQHILNPVAAGVVAVTVLYAFFPLPPGYFESSWWIGQPVMFIPLVLVGLAVVIKVRKWTPVASFLAVAFVVYLFEEWRFTGEFLENWEGFWVSGPSVFLAAFMLTEPFTMPPTKKVQRWYGALVGFLSQTTLLTPFIKITPELALIAGNMFAYAFRIRRKLFLELISKQEIAADTWELVFSKPTGFTFNAGQYLEWMLPHKNLDQRGPRRYFTIASSPTEDVVRLIFKTVDSGSSYKKALLELEPGGQVIASQLAGDFLLPKDAQQKLGFIAGGIGITPFISHVKYLEETQSERDCKLFYCVNEESEMVYKDYFTAVSKDMSLELIPVISNGEVDKVAESGFITHEILQRRVPDYLERCWYLSGPPPMVNAYSTLLKEAGVSSGNIKKDFFPGLA